MEKHRKHEHVKTRVFVFVLVGTLTASLLPAQDAQPPSILVSRHLAELEGLVIGDEVELATEEPGGNARLFRIAGIYEPTPDPMNLGVAPRAVRMHLTDLLALTRDPATPAGAEHVEGINVALVDPEDAQAFANDVNASVPGVIARRAAGAAGSASTFVVLERFHLAIATITIVAATFFLLALTIMLVDERRETVACCASSVSRRGEFWSRCCWRAC